MADAWQKCVNNESESVLVCEAGTGTGKTFAYLIPAILSGKTVVISTASKALQDQLVKKICQDCSISYSYLLISCH